MAAEHNANIEIVDHLRHHSAEDSSHSAPAGVPPMHHRHLRTMEILEAILLAAVALLTAWSGYQAAKWDGESSRAYSLSSQTTMRSEHYDDQSDMLLSYNAATFNGWLAARSSGDRDLEKLLIERMTDEYRVAFRAWLKTDPFNNPDAPSGPMAMPEYRDPLAAKSELLDQQATKEFGDAVHAKLRGEEYVRLTVVLAAVLFLVAIGQRFHMRGVRMGVLGVAGACLVYCVVLISTLPIAR